MKIMLMRLSQGLLLLSLVSGCVAPISKSSIPTVPAELDGKGLVMARFAIPGRGYMEGNQIVISGSTYYNALRAGQLVLALPPGEYEVEKMKSSAGAYIYTVPYKRKFRIEANGITNLGLIVALTDKKEKDKFFTVAADNSREMLRYLRASYPALAKRFPPERMQLAPGNYVDKGKLEALRREIATREINNESTMRKSLVRVGDTRYLHSDAGTLVSFPSKDGKPAKAVIHDTGTLAEILLVSRHENRLAFLSEAGELFLLDGGGLRRLEIPYVINPAKFQVLNKDAIVIVDHEMRIYSTIDGGKNWSRFDGAKIEYPTARYSITDSPRGLYVYTGMWSDPVTILYGRSPYTRFESIAPPARESTLTSPTLVATDAGIFLEYHSNRFHFRPDRTGVWELRNKPSRSCYGKVEFPDNGGKRLVATCDKKRFESNDSGASWKEI